MELVLASSSPRRLQLLRSAGITTSGAQPANINEDVRPGEAPNDYCERLAFEKADVVWKATGQPGNTLVLGADTTVVVDGHIIGKPEDAADANRILQRLSGRSHQVVTGVCLLGNGVHDVRSETTLVHFAHLSEKEIADYVASGEPMDKAGAYGIQGIASRWVPRIDGCYFNIVGLPIPLVYRMLRSHKVA